jgi:hypothetical protein
LSRKEITGIMKTPRSSLGVTVVILAGVFILAILTYVSILGENHKIDRIINSYFTKVKERRYLGACDSFSSGLLKARLASVEQRIRFNFLLELALLKQYNMLDSYEYKIELKRSHLWIPHINDDSIRVSIMLRPRKDNGVLGIVCGEESRKVTRDLIIVGREEGTWKIERFDIADTPLGSIYNDLRKSLNLDKYVQRIPDGFLIKDAAIHMKTLSPMDKRLLTFSLYRIQESLDVPEKKKTGSLLAPASL